MDFGWAIHRERQYCILVHRQWCFDTFFASALAHQQWGNARFVAAMHVRAAIDAVFTRLLEYGWAEYCISDEEVIGAEMSWAMGRDGVKERWATGRDAVGLDQLGDPLAFHGSIFSRFFDHKVRIDFCIDFWIDFWSILDSFFD